MSVPVPETVMMADHGEVIAVVRTLQDAVDLFRLMKQRLGLTNEFIDEVGGLTKGHTDKVLGRSEQKRLGYDTFALFAEMFAVEFRVHINLDAVKRMEAVWEGRERPLFPHGKPGRISRKILEAAKPHIYRDSGRAGGLKRATCLSAKQVARISRKGGKSRAKSLSKQRRREIARAAGLASAAKRRLNIIALSAPCAIALPAPHPDCARLECPVPNA